MSAARVIALDGVNRYHTVWPAPNDADATTSSFAPTQAGTGSPDSVAPRMFSAVLWNGSVAMFVAAPDASLPGGVNVTAWSCRSCASFSCELIWIWYVTPALAFKMRSDTEPWTS